MPVREEEQLSAQQDPTEMVRAYFSAKGIKPSAQDVRTLLEGNTRSQNEGMPGLLPGLRSQAPPPADPAQSGAKTGGAPKQFTDAGGGGADLGATPYAEEQRAAVAGPQPKPIVPPTPAEVQATSQNTIVDPGTGIPATASGGGDAASALGAITLTQIARAILGQQPTMPTMTVTPDKPALPPSPNVAPPGTKQIAPPPAQMGPPPPPVATGPGTVITPPNPDGGVSGAKKVPLPPGRSGAPVPDIMELLKGLQVGRGLHLR